MSRMLYQVLPQNGIQIYSPHFQSIHAHHPFADELPCVLFFRCFHIDTFSAKVHQNMAINEYKSSYLDSLALEICLYLVYVISLHCDN